MKKLHFSVEIQAPKQKVWETLWNDSTYRKWTSVFSEGSYAKTDWKEGSKVLFLSPNGEGMYSEIAKSKPNELMSFRHLGVVKEGKEQPLDDETRKWSGAMESYTLKGDNGATELIVDMDVTEEYQQYFNDNFPKALDKVREIAED